MVSLLVKETHRATAKKNLCLDGDSFLLGKGWDGLKYSDGSGNFEIL
jgi:hypothetical protein